MAAPRVQESCAFPSELFTRRREVTCASCTQMRMDAVELRGLVGVSRGPTGGRAGRSGRQDLDERRRWRRAASMAAWAAGGGTFTSYPAGDNRRVGVVPRIVAGDPDQHDDAPQGAQTAMKCRRPGQSRRPSARAARRRGSRRRRSSSTNPASGVRTESRSPRTRRNAAPTSATARGCESSTGRAEGLPAERP